VGEQLARQRARELRRPAERYELLGFGRRRTELAWKRARGPLAAIGLALSRGFSDA